MGYEIWAGLKLAMRVCHERAVEAGWWIDAQGGDLRKNPLCFSNKLALIHSELSEALEGDRKKLKDSHLPHRDAREVELADALIRLLDLAQAYELDLSGAVFEKLEYNKTRADHTKAARVDDGGKTY